MGPWPDRFTKLVVLQSSGLRVLTYVRFRFCATCKKDRSSAKIFVSRSIAGAMYKLAALSDLEPPYVS
jgi:hypothetical protein